MLTELQCKVFNDCAHQISLTVLTGYLELSKKADKLNAYNTLLEPPATIRNANSIRASQIRKQAVSLWNLHDKAHKAADYINARPTIQSCVSVVDGSEQTYVRPGFLPNFERAPKDETQALAAVDACHAREAQSA